MEFRIEKDSMGEIKVPKDAYYGAQTQRSIINFPIGHEVMPEIFIRAYALIKQSAALTNQNLGILAEEKAQLIIKASQDIIDGKLLDQFPLKIWQTGSGTQTNMNVNEVIAHRANEIGHIETGTEKKLIHPNDHVNLCQSTNDTFPSAIHISAAMMINEDLLPSLSDLHETFLQKASAYKDIIKMGRTHLQDATPLSLGQEMGGYAAQIYYCIESIKKLLPFLYELALGGTAVGTGVNSHKDFASQIAEIIAHKTNLPFVTGKNKFALLASHDALALMSGALNNLACTMMKIANDIRWLASGPRGGLAEIFIAENEPGSSIMPGKINPTQSEALTMVCCQVMGNHTAITVACSQGNFELNVFKPVIMKNLLNSIELLSTGISCFDERCAQTISPNYERLQEFKDRSLMLVTALSPFIGYDKAAYVAKIAHQENKTLKEICVSLNLMTAKEFDDRVKPENMIYPG